MKPQWKDAPDWANYFAMNSNGNWYWYEGEPIKGDKSWISTTYMYKWIFDSNVGYYALAYGFWELTLEKRPGK